MQPSISHRGPGTGALLLALALAGGCSDTSAPADAPAITGSILVPITTIGADLDRDGYVVVVDSTTRRPVRINDTVEVSGLLPRSDHVYTVALDAVASNCVVDGDGSAQKWTYIMSDGRVGETAVVPFTISCFPRSVPPALVTTQMLFGRDGQMYRARLDGTGLALLGSGGSPILSPDGRRIAFNRQDGLYVMDADGANTRRVAATGSAALYYALSSPTWSPDGHRLALASADEDHHWTVVLSVDDATAPVILPPSGSSLAWSPDGNEIAFDAPDQAGGSAVWTMAPDGSDRRQLAHVSAMVTLAWSPDGKQLALAGPDGIAVMNADGSGLRKISSTHGDHPVWSPDGTAIAFTSGCTRSGCVPVLLYVTVDGAMSGLLIENASGSSWRE